MVLYAQPLYRLTSQSRLEWNEEIDAAWSAAKEAAATAIALSHFDCNPTVNTLVATDASDTAIGGALLQVVSEGQQGVQ